MNFNNKTLKNSKNLHPSQNKSVLGCWSHSSSTCIINDPRYFFAHPLLENKDFVPKWFEHIPGKNFIVDTKGYPNICDPIVTKWILIEYSDINKDEYSKLSFAKKRFYAKVCLRLIISGVKIKGNFRDLSNKLKLFGESWIGYFTQQEIDWLITDLTKSDSSESKSDYKHFIACDLVHLGLVPTSECLNKLGEIGALMEYIAGASELDINATDMYKHLSTNWTEDEITPYSSKDGVYTNVNLDVETGSVDTDDEKQQPDVSRVIRPRIFKDLTEPVEVPLDLNLGDDIHPYDEETYNEYLTGDLINEVQHSEDPEDILNEAFDFDESKSKAIDQQQFEAFKMVVNGIKSSFPIESHEKLDKLMGLVSGLDKSNADFITLTRSMVARISEKISDEQQKEQEMILKSIEDEDDNLELDQELLDELEDIRARDIPESFADSPKSDSAADTLD